MPVLEDKPSLFERIKQECRPFANIPPQEGEFMVNYWIDAQRSLGVEISKATAYRQLEERVEAGTIEKRKGSFNGKIVNVYKFKETK